MKHIPTPGRTRDGVRQGYIIPIGGGEEKIRDRAILSRFVDLCGHRNARIAVIPTASERDDTGPRYAELFKDLGVAGARVFPFATRDACHDEEEIEALKRADGIFMTGGNQLRLSTTLGGTPAAYAIRSVSATGVHVAGTSAGAAFLPEHMIAFGKEGPSPRADMVTLAPGLGLTNTVVVDQHFRERDRLGRLITAIGYNPFAVGMGLDEDTAAFIDPTGILSVVGSGSITIVDPSHVEHSSMDSAHQHDPLCVVGLRLHVLTDGWGYDLGRRAAVSAHAAPAS